MSILKLIPKQKKLFMDKYKNAILAFDYSKLFYKYKYHCVKVRRSSDNLIQDFGFVKKKYINLTSSATITGSNTILGITKLYDGSIKLEDSWASIETSGVQWIKFDLGKIYNISDINIWHYYLDGRTYRDVIVQISEDNINWINIFNNDSNNSASQGIGNDSEYIETKSGKKLAVNKNARYIRTFTNGSSDNPAQHYFEVEILTVINEWYIDINSILNFCGTGNGYLHTYYNQCFNGLNAIQITNTNQPQIVSDGLFLHNGIYFIADKYLVISHSDQFNNNGSNISCFVKCKYLTGLSTYAIVGKRANLSATESGWSFKINNNKTFCYFGDGTKGYEPLDITTSANVYYDIGFSKNGSSVKTYLNSSVDLLGSYTTSSYDNTQDFKIGKISDNYIGYIRTIILLNNYQNTNIIQGVI